MSRMRPCIKCSKTEFYAGGRCKPCQRKASLEYQHRYPEKYKETYLAAGKKWRLNNSNLNTAKNSRLKRLYGISLAEWDSLLIAQSGRCEICTNPLILQREPHVDHNHTTGKVRALLCNRCNLMISTDNPNLLRTAASYLERYHVPYCLKVS